jgi:hypothetical protein
VYANTQGQCLFVVVEASFLIFPFGIMLQLGVMLVGLGGNNGTTCVAGAMANKMKLTWETKDGTKSANYWGSVMMASTVKLGNDARGHAVCKFVSRRMLYFLTTKRSQ